MDSETKNDAISRGLTSRRDYMADLYAPDDCEAGYDANGSANGTDSEEEGEEDDESGSDGGASDDSWGSCPSAIKDHAFSLGFSSRREYMTYLYE